MLTSAEKMNSETAIDSTVSTVRRLLRVRFFKTSIAYFIWLPPNTCSLLSRRSTGATRVRCRFAGFDANQNTFVQAINLVNVMFCAHIMSDHQDGFGEAPIQFAQKHQDVIGRAGVEVAGGFIRQNNCRISD